jgi:hypothetical protein
VLLEQQSGVGETADIRCANIRRYAERHANAD